MKYIRTKDGIYEYVDYDNECIIPMPIIKYKGRLTHCAERDIIKQANTIEELCDEFVYSDNVFKNVIYENYNALKILLKIRKNYIVFGAIWTDKGLIYVAKMNEKGELELL